MKHIVTTKLIYIYVYINTHKQANKKKEKKKCNNLFFFLYLNRVLFYYCRILLVNSVDKVFGFIEVFFVDSCSSLST